ncbi:MULTISPECIES: enoyl-CoA hydratase/isomerase family protein [unclassified Streptomyces]|uniref:enoyl-CoA hydratase/isomerase family protein n=1 Tax=unclassified Streptomyces TaxID=2593676 RepID=UPI002E78485B|nr:MULTISPECIES: enoyl-CoA hydratase/isomerase family protein [unclassified Streptomyces]MEE1757779.1 enoyl-CoA hydratase/isomerase family protein [Streptomyces sp. SP18BB07]MEE1836789.1 enoyl-CoA hydratase/isomerase family protein [Streptomyces sp. SP17KL33]
MTGTEPLHTEPLLVEQRGPVRWLSLNRPQRRNALDSTLIAALDKQITSAEADPATTVVAVAGKGPSFCAGGDFHQFLELHDRGENPVGFLTDVSACFSRIAASPKPWVAVLHGHAVAGGLELALACDVVVAADTTLIGDGHLQRRLVPAGGSSVRLPDAVGRGLSRWLLLTGELLPATAFAHTGWIHAIVPEADLEATATRVCRQLADRHSPAQQHLKTLLHRIDGMAPEQALREELATFADNWPASEVADALRAFLTSQTTKVPTTAAPTMKADHT